MLESTFEALNRIGKGSSCQVYKVLNKKEGIVLAENNYLPVDKKGNVNVMIIGRFRCW